MLFWLKSVNEEKLAKYDVGGSGVFFFFCVVSIEDTKPPAPYIENGIDK
jgi:hypothetical protein